MRRINCAAPQQLGDLLACGWGRCLNAANSNTIERFLTAQPGCDQKNCAVRGGFQAAFPLYHMNRHKHRRRKNQNRNQTSNKKKPMQTKQSVTNSNIVIAAFGLLSMLLPVSQSAQAQDIPSRDSAPVVFQAAGTPLTRFRAQSMRFVLPSESQTTSITQGRFKRVDARSTGTVAILTSWIPQLQ